MRAFPIAALAVLLAACGGASPDAGSTSTTAATTSTTTVASSSSSTTTTTTTTTTTITTAPSITTTSTLSLEETRWVVSSITDGDTFTVETPAGLRSVRLIGINAPEGGECLADEAATALQALVAGRSVAMESDVSDVDQFDRWLRYVYVDGLLVNEALVEQGMAIANRYEPDTALAAVLEAAQARAEEAAAGMWAPDACSPVAPAGMVAIDHVEYDAPGNDNQNLNEEWVRFVNDGATGADLTGWSVKDESASHRYGFPERFALAPGASVVLHTGCGTDTAADLYWCNTGSAVWNNDGDTVFLLDPGGNIVAAVGY